MSDRGKTETDNERGEIGRWRKVKHKAKYKMGGGLCGVGGLKEEYIGG